VRSKRSTAKPVARQPAADRPAGQCFGGQVTPC
jgi:hypothetical protein